MKPSVSYLRAIGFAVLGFALWVMSDACMKLTGESALPPYEVVGFLGFFGVLVMLVKTAPQGNFKALWPKNPRAQLGRAMLAVCVNFLNVMALKHLPLTLFYITVFTAPMMIAIMASCFLGEHLKWPKILALVIGFLGVVIAIDPFQDAARGEWIGYAAAFGAAGGFAGGVIWVRVITRSESNDSLVFFAALTEMIVGFAVMLWHAEPVTARLLVILFGMGALSVLGNLAVYHAIKHAAAATVSQFHYTQIITGAVLGYIIWHEIPTLHMITGVAIIIGSGLYIAAHAPKAENLAAVGPH